MSAPRSYCVCIFQTRACEHTGSGNLFASAQCLGYRQEHGSLTQEICLPPDHIVIKQVKATAKLIKAKALFVATDDRPLIKELTKALKHMKVSIWWFLALAENIFLF